MFFMNNMIFVFIAAVVIITALGLHGTGYLNNFSTISSFEECAAAGNPVMESYPRQCRDPLSGKTFVEDITRSWRNDGIVLMQHETEGFFGCFGCSSPEDGLALCIDPVQEMMLVEETLQRYCNSEFKLVEP